MKSAACAVLLALSGLFGGAAWAAPAGSSAAAIARDHVVTAPRLASPALLHAQVVCERAGIVGRVRCDVEAQVDGARITWGDAQIVDCPKFAFPLKGRIGPDDAAVRTPERWRWAFGLVAKEVGSGSISVRVRAVVCTGDACDATSVIVAAPLVVGS
ncbi:MAG: hypothetical protein ABI461_20975 [Polyangiaceae bacterium]